MTVTGPKICLMLLTIKINIIMRFIKNLIKRVSKDNILEISCIITILLTLSFLLSTLFVHCMYENIILKVLLSMFLVLVLLNNISFDNIITKIRYNARIMNVPNIVLTILILIGIPIISIIIVSVPTYLIIMAITHHSIKLGILFVCSIIIILYYMMRAEN